MTNHIFVIGFNKTGTRTIHNFFEKNGILSIHWDYNKLVDTFEKNIKENKKLLTNGIYYKNNKEYTYDEIIVFSDITKITENKDPKDYYKLLDQQYPNSKFILNIRNVDDWIRSRKNHDTILERQMKYFQTSEEEVEIIWTKMFYDHYSDVLRYFENRPSDLLIFDLDKDKCDKIIDFFKDTFVLNPEYWIIIK